MSMPPSDLDTSIQPEGRATMAYQLDNISELDDQLAAPSILEATTADLWALDDKKSTDDSFLPSQNKFDITSISLLDSNQERSVGEHDTSLIPGMQPRRPTAATALSSAVHDFPPLESGIENLSPSTLEPKAFPDPTAATSADGDIGTETQIEANENENETTALEPNQFHSWKAASERVVIGVIQCLTETKDMELSYVSLLSTITVLNSRLDHEGVNDGEVGVPSVAPVEAIETDDPVGKLYAQLLSIMTRRGVVEGLIKETLRQGVLSQDTLYIRLYKAILNVGYHLQVILPIFTTIHTIFFFALENKYESASDTLFILRYSLLP